MKAAWWETGNSVNHLVWLGLKSNNVTALLSYLDDPERFVRFMAASELRMRPSRRVFVHAASLLRSDAMRQREIGAFILSQLGAPRRPYKNESMPILLRAVSRERNTAVRAMIISALGKLKAQPALRQVLRFANDRSPRVRGEVAVYIGLIYCMRSKSIPPRFMRLLHKFNSERSRVVRWHASLALELVRGPTPEERAERREWLAKQRRKARRR